MPEDDGHVVTGDAQGPEHDEAVLRARSRLRDATDDARRAEREVFELRRELKATTWRLSGAEKRIAALEARRSLRWADRLAGALRTIRRNGSAAALPTKQSRPSPDRDRPARYRADLLERLRGSGGVRVAVVGGTVDLDKALTEAGFHATDPSSADAILALDKATDPLTLPMSAIRVGIRDVSAEPEEWDVLVEDATDPAGALRTALQQWVESRRVSIRMPTGGADRALAWGDTFFARDLRRAFRAEGWPARLHFHDGWADPAVGRDDLVLDLVGVYEPPQPPGACRIAWQISHPELAGPELYAAYDAVFVASGPYAEHVRTMTDRPVRPLLQATDADRFRPGLAGPRHELLVVANWRPGGRRVIDDLIPTDHDLAVYGRGWTADHLDPRYHAGEFVPNDELANHYASATIVLCDHAPAMRREGFLSNRLFDATAAGAAVISDDVEGLDAAFDGGVPGYRDRDHLRALIEATLGDAASRQESAARARRAVLDRHTFRHRARDLIAAAETFLGQQEPPTW